MHKNADTCFNCGKEIKADKCPYCGYQNTLESKCPRKKGMLCVHTRKACKVAYWQECEVLRSND